jgi:hypothetical protein
MQRRPAFPAILLVLGFAGVARFLGDVRTVDAIGLVASGALIGVSTMRLVLALRRR